MYLSKEYQTITYTRTSKLGHEHEYNRTRTVLVFRCDNCSELFTRLKEDISPARLSNNYFHCCTRCDSKRFAQQKGAERRTIWDKPASSLDDISKI